MGAGRPVQVGVRARGRVRTTTRSCARVERACSAWRRSCRWGCVASPPAEIRELVDRMHVYVTFDVDAVDPAFAPGTGTPVPGGLSSREALELERSLAGIHLVGMNVVELSPPLDEGGRTASLAAHLVFEGLALARRSLRDGHRCGALGNCVRTAGPQRCG